MKMMKSARSAAGGAVNAKNAKRHRHRKEPLAVEWMKTRMSGGGVVGQSQNRDVKTARR